MRLFLIRHGQTPNNVTGALDTAYPGAGLTPLGEAQARAIPAALSEEPIAAVYTSDRVRTQLTAAPLAKARALEVTVRSGLEEVNAGALELRSDSEAVQSYVGTLAAWIRGDLDRRMPGGTTGHSFVRRYSEALRAIAAEHDEGDAVVVVSHGAAIRVYTALHARGLDPEHAARVRIMNTGMAVLEGDPDRGWHLSRWSTEPLGGHDLEPVADHDVTGGESLGEAARHG